MATINPYSIGPDYSNIMKPSQNVRPISTGAGGGEKADVGRTANKADQVIGVVNAGAQTVNNIANINDTLNRGPRSGANVGDKSVDTVPTGGNLKQISQQTKLNLGISDNTPSLTVNSNLNYDKFNTQVIQNHLNNLQNDWRLNYAELDQPNVVNTDDIMNGKGDFYLLKRDGNNLHFEGQDIKFQDELYKPHTIDDLGLNWWSARNVALPVLQYAAQFNQLDSKNKWLQAGMTTQRIMQNFAGRDPVTNLYRPTVLDDYYISNFVDVVDMSVNWKDRNAWQNAVAGATSAVNMIKNFGWSESLGGDRTLTQMADGLAYLNFGNSIYYLGNNWNSMNGEERVAGVVQATYAGVQAYNGGSLLIDKFAPAADVATPTTASVTGTGVDAAVGGTAGGVGGASGTGAASTAAGNISTIGGSFMAVAGAYSMTKGIEGMANVFGQGTAASRKTSALSGMTAGMGAASLGLGTAVLMGAQVGASLGFVGAAIGAAVGAAVGLATGSVKAGKSTEQRARDTWRSVYAQTGIFSQAPHSGGGTTYAMQLADGRWYDVGHDGSGSRATFINGDAKSIAHPERLTESDRNSMTTGNGEIRGVLPYNVDYTNDLDFVGSLMLTGMIVPIGGTYQKQRASEVPQMLGYMTNGITSNCGREFTLANYKVMADNAKALYSKIGITNKQQMVNSMGEAYLYGQIDYNDYMNSLTAANLMYDDNGYEQAKGMMQGVQEQPQVPSNS